jgi:hypothetical protein
MNQWNKYPDKEPPLNEYLLCHGTMENQLEPDIHKCYFYEVNDRQKKEFQFWESDWSTTINDVTHWMLLPTPPGKRPNRLMENELLTCPFCGAKNFSFSYNSCNIGMQFRLKCENCGCYGPVNYINEGECIKSWNTRHDSPHPQKEEI